MFFCLYCCRKPKQNLVKRISGFPQLRHIPYKDLFNDDLWNLSQCYEVVPIFWVRQQYYLQQQAFARQKRNCSSTKYFPDQILSFLQLSLVLLTQRYFWLEGTKMLLNHQIFWSQGMIGRSLSKTKLCRPRESQSEQLEGKGQKSVNWKDGQRWRLISLPKMSIGHRKGSNLSSSKQNKQDEQTATRLLEDQVLEMWPVEVVWSLVPKSCGKRQKVLQATCSSPP